MPRPPVEKRSLGAIAQAIGAEPIRVRSKIDTLDYEDRPIDRRRPGASSERSSPELIVIGEAPVGRATLHAIECELKAPAEPPIAQGESPACEPVSPRPIDAGDLVLAATQIHEIATFVVTGGDAFANASEEARRGFVEARLLHRLPVLSMADVVRIDVGHGATAETATIRVWCRVSTPRNR